MKILTKVPKYIILLTFFIMQTQQADSQVMMQNDQSIPDRKWWKEAVFYQIYPRSFKDSNGDGVGDIKGIISKLDYIKKLGVDAVWLNPIYASPNYDNGYDISDYQSIMTEFGTMDDFNKMLKGFHDRKIKVIMDLVVNHCSSNHKWFKEARKSRSSKYYNYFHWWPAENGVPPKRISFFDENANGWKYNKETNSYYLHYFAAQQPDLNWENPVLRQEIYKMMRFWLDKGIDGFRMDAIAFISKDIKFPLLPPEYNGNWAHYYANGPFLHDYIKEMNTEVLSKYDVATVAEAEGSVEKVIKFVDPANHELNMAYHFEGVELGYLPNVYKRVDPNGYNLLEFKHIYSKWDSAFSVKGWGTIYLGNHDQPRMLTRWGNDTPEFREVSSKMLTTFILSMRATPYYYFGDELGMNNIKFDKIDDYNDIELLTNYMQVKQKGGDLKRFMEDMKISSRDNGRTPFQWNTSENAGFTTGTPWLKINPNYKYINVESEEADSNSTLNYFKKMVGLRKNNLTLIYGSYHMVDENNPDVYAYTRELNGNRYLVVLNFKPRVSILTVSFKYDHLDLEINNYPDKPRLNDEHELILKPYQSVIYKVSK
ncbi:MAG: alpha-glucosidase [Mucilaginibacter sp.]|nr:alpha-glucosidase [Mucilaginibacter sp.]